MNMLLSLFYAISMVTLWGKRDEALAFIRKEKYLTLLLMWSFCSVFWSGDTVVSLKRWIALFGEAIVCLAALLHFRWSEVGLRYFRIILSLYIPVTIASVIFIPEAIQWQFPAWRGLEDTKNNLGQVAVFSTVIILGIISFHRGISKNIWHFVLLAGSLACLIGAQSTTSFLISASLLGIWGLLWAGRVLGNKLVAVFYAIAVLLGGAAILAIIAAFAPEIYAWFFGLFGKDLTFTGRVELWQTVLRMTEDKFLFGWGLGGFWVMDSPHLIPVFQQFVWIPNQAHQGYIDVYSQLGIVGLFSLVLVIISYFRGLAQLQKKQIWMWIFLGMIILNFQESIFLRPRHSSNFLFLFSYIALYTDLIKEKMQ